MAITPTPPIRQPRVAIIGTGFSGLAAAIGLKQAGMHNVTIFERTSAVGGVWQHNTYPGAACDVASSLYSFSFEPNPNWSRPFAPQAEIRAYLEHCVDSYDLRRHLVLDTEIVKAEFDEAAGQWQVQTAAGDTHLFNVVISACGQLTRPRYPDLPGIADFTGTLFHSAEWDSTHDLSGKRVAIIGNGASAIQLIPHVAAKATSLAVFQRSAEYLLPKPDYAIPEWQKTLHRRLPSTLSALRGAWWAIGEYVNPALMLPMGRLRHAYLAPLYAASKAQLHLQVRDAGLRAKLTPDYQMGCKRILLSSEYYPAVAQDHVEVVTDRITEIAPNGVVTSDGTKREVDTIIFATGFNSNGFIAPMQITGLNGADLNETWSGTPAAYLGMTVPKFPNLFLMYGPNTNFGGGSIVYILESQARYIVDAVQALARSDADCLDVTRAAFERFTAEAQRRLAGSVWVRGGCTSWYQNAEGKVTNNWPGLMSEYRFRTRKINLRDYDLRSAR